MNSNRLKERIADHNLVCGTVGLGYVGLPLAVEKAKAGFKTVGFDVQVERADMVNRGENYIGDVVQEDLAALVAVSYTHLLFPPATALMPASSLRP